MSERLLLSPDLTFEKALANIADDLDISLRRNSDTTWLWTRYALSGTVYRNRTDHPDWAPLVRDDAAPEAYLLETSSGDRYAAQRDRLDQAFPQVPRKKKHLKDRPSVGAGDAGDIDSHYRMYIVTADSDEAAGAAVADVLGRQLHRYEGADPETWWFDSGDGEDLIVRDGQRVIVDGEPRDAIVVTLDKPDESWANLLIAAGYLPVGTTASLPADVS